MRVLVNRYCELERRTGIGNYSKQLAAAMLRVSHPITIESFPQGWVKEVESSRVQRRARLSNQTEPTADLNGAESSASILSWTEKLIALGRRNFGRYLPGTSDRLLQRQYRMLSSGCDLYHEPNCIPWDSDLPTITTLPDLSVIVHPEWHPAPRVEEYERRFERGMRQCVRILTISDFSRSQIVQELGIPAERITRTYCGINPSLRQLRATEIHERRQEMGLPEDYLLYVGTLEPRKNLLMLLEAYCSLSANVRQRCPLVLVGGWGWNIEKLASYLEDEARPRGVVHIGYVRDEQLITLYNGARKP